MYLDLGVTIGFLIKFLASLVGPFKVRFRQRAYFFCKVVLRKVISTFEIIRNIKCNSNKPLCLFVTNFCSYNLNYTNYCGFDPPQSDIYNIPMRIAEIIENP